MDPIVVLAVVAVLLIGVGIVVWRRREKRLAHGPITSGPPRPGAGLAELTCPACGHRFRPPDIIVTTEAVARQYGPNPVQCPRCDHIWSGPPRHTIRG